MDTPQQPKLEDFQSMPGEDVLTTLSPELHKALVNKFEKGRLSGPTDPC